jgi:hypothetical protein
VTVVGKNSRNGHRHPCTELIVDCVTTVHVCDVQKQNFVSETKRQWRGVFQQRLVDEGVPKGAKVVWPRIGRISCSGVYN